MVSVIVLSSHGHAKSNDNVVLEAAGCFLLLLAAVAFFWSLNRNLVDRSNV